jgi:biotin transport system substrate-specific component
MVGVYTAAILLSPKCAILSQICYLLLGAVGIPVFGGFRGGMGALLGPTGGYLLVYPIMAAIISLTLNGKQALSAERNQRHILIKGAISICTAHLVLYLGGTIWLSATTGNSFVASLSLAVIPYIPLDIIKIAFCVFAIIPLRKHFMKMGMLTMQKPFG